jgi:hypothetical protein
VDAFATDVELAAWLKGGDYEAETPVDDAADRVLARATELIGWASFGTYTVDSLTGLPVLATVVDALRDATCAQVEQWLEVGEESDIGGWDQDTTKITSPIAPRAIRILTAEGILNAAALALLGDAVPLAPIGVDIV